MRFDKSSNPVFSKNRFDNIAQSGVQSGEVMTIKGTINKTLLLFGILLLSGAFAWNSVKTGGVGLGLVIPGAIFGLIIAIVTVFKPQWSPYTAPAYAFFEGLVLGAVSALYAGAYNGIVGQAIGLTLSILFVMLFAYRSGLIKATERFKRIVIIATAGVAVFYVLNFIFSLFGGGVSLGNFGLLGIGIQLAIVVIASLNLILDFDGIEQGAQAGMPKWAEWYSGFGLMVTLVWLYLEILRLLSLLSNR
jgi:uncharacterized YccA/Bax inhibitor family protein